MERECGKRNRKNEVDEVKENCLFCLNCTGVQSMNSGEDLFLSFPRKPNAEPGLCSYRLAQKMAAISGNISVNITV
jgi:hypothetical protein